MSDLFEPPARTSSSDAGTPRLRFARRLLEGLGLVKAPQRAALRAAPLRRAWDDGRLTESALRELAAGQAASADNALRIVAFSPKSPIVERLLPEAVDLAQRGVRVAVLLSLEPGAEEEIALLASISKALRGAPVERFLRLANFKGAEDCLEQAMIGDRAYWTGARLGERRQTPLADGALMDLTISEQAALAARLRFAAAWRLSGAPSPRLKRRIAESAAE